jgi:hypothetical protein
VGRALRDGGPGGDQIEFLEPRDFAFGGGVGAEFSGFDGDDLPDPDDGEPRPRWLGAAAGLVVVALVAIGVVAAAPWDGSGGQAAAPTTTAAPAGAGPLTPTSAPLPTTPATVAPATGVDGTHRVHGYVLDPPPAGFSSSGAWDAYVPSVTPRGRSELWAAAGATRTTGHWFSVSSVEGDAAPWGVAATRIDLGGQVGFLQRESGSVLRLSSVISARSSRARTLSMSATGLGVADVIALFASIDPDALGTPDPGSRTITVDGAPVEFDRLVSVPTDSDLLDRYVWGGVTQTATSYRGPNGAWISITAADSSDWPAAIDTVAPFALDPAQADGPLHVPAELGGARGLTVGSLGGTDSFVRWVDDGGAVLTVTASIPVDQLLPLLGTLRVATDREWDRARNQVWDLPEDETLAQPTGPVFPLGDGVLSDGTAWHGSFQNPGWIDFATDQARTSYPIDLVGSVLIGSFESCTMVMASVPADSPATTVRLRVGGETLLELPLTPLASLDPTVTSTSKAAVFAFEQMGGFEVELLAADGTVVERQHSPGFE